MKPKRNYELEQSKIMEAELFEKLGVLKGVIGQMSLSDKMSFIALITSKLKPEQLKFEDGSHEFSEENLLSVGLITRVTADRDEFERIGGLYGGGYQSDLRKGLYHGCGDTPIKIWRKEIRKLFHVVTESCADLQLPPLKEGTGEFGAGSWKESKYEIR